MTLVPAPVDLVPLLAARAAAWERATGRTVDHALDPGLPPARGDAAAVSTVVDHLIDNAVRYSPVGEPVVLSAFAEAHQVRVHVTDGGDGLPAGEASWRLAAAGHRGGRRHGGLVEVRSLVDLMGGRVHVHSERGWGTTFVVVLPRADIVASAVRFA